MAEAYPHWRNRLIWSAGLAVLGLLLAFVITLCHGSDPDLLFGPEVLMLIAQLTAIQVLWKRGSFRSPMFFTLFAMAVGVVLIGALFKIQHWPTADLLLLCGSAGLILIYGLHYLRKRSKRPSDHLKLIWIVCAVSAAIIRVEHLWRFADELAMLAVLLFWSMVGVYAWEQRMQRHTPN